MDFDYVVIGSGFGGSVSALRLVEKGYRVAVLEQGRRWSADNLPKTNWDVRNWIWRPGLFLKGFFGVRFFRHMVVLHGNAVGGGSITYGNTLLVPPEKVWRRGSWAGLAEWEKVMPDHYASAKRMLGVTTNRRLGPADNLLHQMATLVGAEETFYPTEVGVFFGDVGDSGGTAYADPYFGGEGPERHSCNGCGACMVGCRVNAKNTLDKNYLYLAEQKGASVLSEAKVVDVRPINRSDGSDGYEVIFLRNAGKLRRVKQTVRAKGVVFSASSLGTQELLFRLKEKKSLPKVSNALGNLVRTNAESLIGVRYPGVKEPLSEGIAIGSGIYLDEFTHIEAVRYPKGSDLIGFITTLMAPGRPGWSRVGQWLLAIIAQLCRNPLKMLRFFLPINFARETIIFLCMQTLEDHLTVRFKRPWYWPFSKRLVTEGKKVPTFIPQANQFAMKVAKATGGVPLSTLSEILLDVPMTAHCMGGAAMAANSSNGVCDYKNRVFGYYNMYICDGSMLAANLGVNPSLTIAALTEHAMSHVPHRSEQTWDEIGIERAC